MKRINNFDQLLVFIKNQPLIQAKSTLINLKPNLMNKSGSIFFGTGLCTPNNLSAGLPFDTLAMVLTAEQLRQKLGFKNVFHQIADTHAQTNSFSPDLINITAQNNLKVFTKICQNLKLRNFKTLLASHVQQDKLHQQIFAQIKNLDHHKYVLQEITDIEWFAQKHNVRLKIGWTIQDSPTTFGNDERVFDQLHQKIFGNTISLVLLKPGRTLDKTRQKVSPYITITGESRLLLNSQENVKQKLDQATKEWGDKQWGGTRKHLQSIVRLFEELFGDLANQSLEQKIDFIIKKCLA